MIIKLENLKLENKQLRCELTELREKMSTEEFVALENETAKEHEVRKGALCVCVCVCVYREIEALLLLVSHQSVFWCLLYVS